MSIPTIIIDENEKCKQCGKGGACKTDKSDEYGLCLKCVTKNLKSTTGGTMDLRFEDAPEQAIQIMRECITKYFPELHQAKILILMDTKKRESQRAIVISRLLKTNDLHRHLSVEESGHDDGYDYIMCLDKLAWSFMADEDKVRLIRHELRHTEVDGESEKNPYKIRCHTIEDFFSEVQLNEDDPHWVRRVGESLMAAYEAQKDPQQKLF